MIKEYLKNHYYSRRFFSSYLIIADDLDLAKKDLKEFLSIEIFNAENIDTHPDYMEIAKTDNIVKNISIDQIRSAQKFLYKTSVISGKQAIVIESAEYMNKNASNCFLKILEETPSNSHIFLLVHNSFLLPETLLSRCIKINHHYHGINYNIDEELIKPCISPVSQINFIENFISGDRNHWLKWALSIELLILKFCRHILGISTELSATEVKILDQIKNHSVTSLQQKHLAIHKITNDTIKYDLWLPASALLIMEELK